VNFIFLRNVLLKGLVIFAVLGLVIGVIPLEALGRFSLYNSIVTGRPRLPFGETPQRSYNLSLYNLEAMFAAHEISGATTEDVAKVVLLGDSSVWGTLLRPDQTLAGQLDQQGLEICGKPARFFNLGYPTISLAKDVMILQRVLQNEPDLIVWVTTLEAFPKDKQFSSPLLENNPATAAALFPETGILSSLGFWDQTVFGKRRDLADWARLQLYGIPWAATGIDQDYPERYPAAEIDLEADESFHNLRPGDDLRTMLAWDVLKKGMELTAHAGIPVILVNEPILVSNGLNSDIRYNFYYPRWAYDAYRADLRGQADENGWAILDAWNSEPMTEFTNSAIHLTPRGEEILAGQVAAMLGQVDCR